MRVPVGDFPYWIRKAMVDLEFEVEMGEFAKEELKKKGLPLDPKRNPFLIVMLPEMERVLREHNLLDVLMVISGDRRCQAVGYIVFERRFCRILP